MAAPKKIKVRILLPVQARFDVKKLPGDTALVPKKKGDEMIALKYAEKVSKN